MYRKGGDVEGGVFDQEPGSLSFVGWCAGKGGVGRSECVVRGGGVRQKKKKRETGNLVHGEGKLVDGRENNMEESLGKGD